MSRRIEAVKRGARRRRRTLAAVTVSIAALGVFAITAIAVHDEDFQLDAQHVRGHDHLVGGDTQTIDWDSLFTPNGTPAGSVRGATVKDPLPAGFESAGFDDDFNANANGSFNTSDASTFATGSKDTLPITPRLAVQLRQQRQQQDRRDERVRGVVRRG